MKKMKNAGFSLIELMVVVGIIGILASMAIPRFQEFQAKARQSEAKTNLNYIATLQEAYFDDPTNMNQYLQNFVLTSANCAAGGNTPSFGFKPSPCNKLGYDYDTMANPAMAGTLAYLATAMEANGLVFMCLTSVDMWTIDEGRNLLHPAPHGASC